MMRFPKQERQKVQGMWEVQGKQETQGKRRKRKKPNNFFLNAFGCTGR